MVILKLSINDHKKAIQRGETAVVLYPSFGSLDKYKPDWGKPLGVNIYKLNVHITCVRFI